MDSYSREAEVDGITCTLRNMSVAEQHSVFGS